MMRNDIFFILLLGSTILTYQCIKSHSIEIRQCITIEGNLRVFVEHWHGDLDSPLEAGTMILVADGVTTTTDESAAIGLLNNHDDRKDLPGCVNGVNNVVNSCVDQGAFMSRDDWVYFDFSVQCDNFVNYTFLEGRTVYLEDGCPDTGPLLPAVIGQVFSDSSGPAIYFNEEYLENETITLPCIETDSYKDTEAQVFYTYSATDDCDAVPSIDISIESGSTFPVGTTQVTLTATDSSAKVTTRNVIVCVEVASEPPSIRPTAIPSLSALPTIEEVPSSVPSLSRQPSDPPSFLPSISPTFNPSPHPSMKPSVTPSFNPSMTASSIPSNKPSNIHSSNPSDFASVPPSMGPSDIASSMPSLKPSQYPSDEPSATQSATPSMIPTDSPTSRPSDKPSPNPSFQPSINPSIGPTPLLSDVPTHVPSNIPSLNPSESPSLSLLPSIDPTALDSMQPSESLKCRDDPEFEFDTDTGETKNCKWLGKNGARKDTYCDAKVVENGKWRTPKFYCREVCADFLPDRIKKDCGFVTTTQDPTPSPIDTVTPDPTPLPITEDPTAPPTFERIEITSNPSNVPSIIESDIPSSTPSLFCVDDATFEFEIVTGEMEDCVWLGASEERIDTYCNTKIVGDPTRTRVKFKCRETCFKFLPKLCGGETPSPTTVPSESGSISMMPSSAPSLFCVDDETFEFEIVTGEMEDCVWLGESEERIDAYCNTKIVDDATKTRVKFKCRETCFKFLPRLCGGETPFPTAVPSESGSISMMPSPAPSSFCVDDETFEFEIVTGEMEDCVWLSESEERIDAYCNTKIVDDATKTRVKFKCRETCFKFLPRLCGGETPSPTTVPSESGSISMIPSPAPSSFCVDDETFEFEIVTGEMEDCVWLSESEERIDAYCNTKIVDDATKTRVKFKCRETCFKFLPRLCGGETPSPTMVPSESDSMSSISGCVDDETFEFEIINGEMKDCAWLGENEDRETDYCDTKILGDRAKVKFKCRETCSAWLPKLCG